MDGVAAALKASLEGVELPADKGRLLEYAVQRHVEPHHLEVLGALPDRTFVSIDDVLRALSPKL